MRDIVSPLEQEAGDRDGVGDVEEHDTCRDHAVTKGNISIVALPSAFERHTC